MMKLSMERYCEEYGMQSLLKEWDYKKNKTLTPENVSYGSRQKVWWVCEKGHHWQAAAYTRTGAGSGCPYCAGKKVLVGFNDLATREPKVAAQWHPTLNGNLTPQMVTAGSKRKAWWRCSEGHVWKSVISSRAGPQKCSCPVCAGKVKAKRLKRYQYETAENAMASYPSSGRS